MALIRATTSSSGGGSFVETDLCPSGLDPTATSLGDTTVTLIDSIANYDYIKIEFRTQSSPSTVYDVLFPVSLAQSASGTTNEPICALATYYNSYGFVRYCIFLSNTSLRFAPTFYVNTTGTADGAKIVPLRVIGLKG